MSGMSLSMVEAEQVLQDLDLPELADTAAEAEALATANAYLHALRQIEADIASADAELRATIQLLYDRHASRSAAMEARATYLRDTLARVYRAYPATGKAKSRKLLGGTIGTRQKPARWVVDDAEILLTWAQAVAPALVTTPPVKPRVLVSDLSAWTAEHVEIGEIPGAHCEPASDEFYARPV